MERVKAEIARFKNTCIWSVEGWLAAWRSEATLRQWTLVNVISVGLTFLVTMTPGERALIWALGLLILALMSRWPATGDHIASSEPDAGSRLTPFANRIRSPQTF